MNIPLLRKIEELFVDYVIPGDKFKSEKIKAAANFAEQIQNFHYFIDVNPESDFPTMYGLFLTEVGTDYHQEIFKNIWPRPIVIEMLVPGEILINNYTNNTFLPSRIRKAIKPLIIDWNNVKNKPIQANAVWIRVAPLTSRSIEKFAIDSPPYSTFGEFYDHLFNIKRTLCSYMGEQANFCNENKL